MIFTWPFPRYHSFISPIAVILKSGALLTIYADLDFSMLLFVLFESSNYLHLFMSFLILQETKREYLLYMQNDTNTTFSTTTLTQYSCFMIHVQTRYLLHSHAIYSVLFSCTYQRVWLRITEFLQHPTIIFWAVLKPALSTKFTLFSYSLIIVQSHTVSNSLICDGILS